tara:strand:- start:1174 stop:1710 length:537 start_codon:yes stop_codon:yes gene_type:complete
MNNLQQYVNYAQPVVKVINEQHNQFFRLEYFSVSPEDLKVEQGVIEFMCQEKHLPSHFTGEIPLVYAQWGEETGASIVLQITPEQRKLLTPEVLSVFHQEGWNTDWKKWWNKTADQTVYLLLDHVYFQTYAGFEPSTEFEDSVGVGFGLDFLSHRLGLNYLVIHEGWHDLESILNCEE